MADFHVFWDIDLEADSPEEAAEIAREIQLDPDSHATFFVVTNVNTDERVMIETRRVG